MVRTRSCRVEGEKEVVKDYVISAEFERDYERAVNLYQNKTFREGMRNFVTIDDVDFPDGLESVNTSCISFPNLHNLYHEALGSVKIQQCESATFPKLPFPMTVINSKSSIVND